jgi:transcriptional regulator with XRE-family HTH domain
MSGNAGTLGRGKRGDPGGGGAGIAESTISEVLSGKRRLTRAQLEKLAAYFHVVPAVFMTPAGNGKKNHTGRRH